MVAEQIAGKAHPFRAPGGTGRVDHAGRRAGRGGAGRYRYLPVEVGHVGPLPPQARDPGDGGVDVAAHEQQRRPAVGEDELLPAGRCAALQRQVHRTGLEDGQQHHSRLYLVDHVHRDDPFRAEPAVQQLRGEAVGEPVQLGVRQLEVTVGQRRPVRRLLYPQPELVRDRQRARHGRVCRRCRRTGLRDVGSRHRSIASRRLRGRMSVQCSST